MVLKADMRDRRAMKPASTSSAARPTAVAKSKTASQRTCKMARRAVTSTKCNFILVAAPRASTMRVVGWLDPAAAATAICNRAKFANQRPIQSEEELDKMNEKIEPDDHYIALKIKIFTGKPISSVYSLLKFHLNLN